MQRVISSIFVAVLFLFGASLVNADAVHKWVDVNGVTHYSDEVPSDEVKTVTQINLPVYSSSSSDAENDYYSIANQWMRVHEQRLALEKIKLEKAKQEAALRPVEPQVIVVNETNRRGIFLPRKRFVGHAPYYGDHYKKKRHGHDYNAPYKLEPHFNHGKDVGYKSPERHAFKTR